jgi:hypothetical protein
VTIIHRSFTLLAVLFLLTGCIADQKNRQDNTGPAPAPPVVNVTNPPAQTVDLAPLKTEIQTSSNQTQAQLSGLITTSISKMAEKLVGLESSISANMTNTAVANLQAKLEATNTMVAKLEADLKVNAEVNANFQNTMKMINDLKFQVGELNTSLKGIAAAQVGVGNKMESLQQDVKNTAGRDVNYLPKEAVDIMRSQDRVTMYIVGGILTLLTTIAGYGYKLARQREQNLNQLLMKALARLHPDQSRDLV